MTDEPIVDDGPDFELHAFTDGNVRVSQMPVEVLVLPVPFARVSQMPVEVLIGTVPATPTTWRPKVTFV